MKIIVGEKYKNIHNGKIYIVTDKKFFNVAYRECGEREAGSPSYAHYKTFSKHWVHVEVGDGLPVEGGLRGFVNYLNRIGSA